MNRRAFLGAVGSAASLGVVSREVASALNAGEIRVWFSDAAGTYDGLGERVAGYLRAALADPLDGLTVSIANETVSLPAEDGRDVLANVWPQKVAKGTAGLSDVDPVGGVNLLVTDGDPTSQPAGFARPHAAAVTGASEIAESPAADAAGAVVDYSVSAVAVQLLLHECGHALGAAHEHGAARRVDGAVVASPMVGSYVWASKALREKHLPDDGGPCGGGLSPPAPRGERKLGLRYTSCARRAIRRRHAELLP